MSLLLLSRITEENIFSAAAGVLLEETHPEEYAERDFRRREPGRWREQALFAYPWRVLLLHEVASAGHFEPGYAALHDHAQLCRPFFPLADIRKDDV